MNGFVCNFEKKTCSCEFFKDYQKRRIMPVVLYASINKVVIAVMDCIIFTSISKTYCYSMTVPMKCFFRSTVITTPSFVD